VSASHRRRRRGARVAQVQFITDNLGGDIHPGFSIWRYLEVASTEIGRPADRTYPRRIASPCSAPHRTRRNDGTTAHERRRRRPRPTGAATARPPATVRATTAASFGVVDEMIHRSHDAIAVVYFVMLLYYVNLEVTCVPPPSDVVARLSRLISATRRWREART